MFNPRWRSQSIRFLTFLFVACLLLSGISSATPSITLSKKTGPPTTRILVSGCGFEPNVGVDIYFDTKDEALAVTDSKGEFHNAKAYAPRSARPGQHWVTALERNNDKGAQKPFLVQTDWSQFRFDADGTRLNPYENVLNPKTVGSLDLKWGYATGGGVESSPAVVNGVVFIGSDDYNLYALESHTGALLWTYPTNSYVWCGPAVVKGVVYFGSGAPDDSLYALDAHTGALLWKYTVGGGMGGGFYAGPTVVRGVAYFGSIGRIVYALNARTGHKLWSYTTPGPIYNPPAVAEGVVYVGVDAGDDHLHALNARTGALLWSFAGVSGYAMSGPTVANGVVYVGSEDHNVYALNARTGVKLWSYLTGDSVVSLPAVANGVVYVSSDDHNIYALDARTGALLWSYRTGSFVVSSPAVANGLVYVGSWDGNVYALNAHTGAPLWSYATGGGVDSSPAVANGMVYIGSGDYNVNLYAFSLEYGSEEASGSSQRPDLKTRRPDFNLKVSQPVATPSGPD